MLEIHTDNQDTYRDLSLLRDANGTVNHEVAKEIRHRAIFDDRNIKEEFKEMSQEEIISTLSESSCPLKVFLNNSIMDFNWGTVVRNANGFNLSEIRFCGRKRYDRRGTVGAHHYSNVTYRDSLIESIKESREQGYKIVAAEYDERFPMHSVNDYDWDEKSVIVFGEEGVSIPTEVLELVDDIVYIPMFGSVRSFNVGTASGIMMNSYRSQHS